MSTSIDETELRAVKSAFRTACLARRAAMVRPDAGACLAAVVLEQVRIPVSAVIAGFWPLADEIDLRPLLHGLHARGHRLALPETPKRGEALIFRHWHPEATMIVGRFGTTHPDGPPQKPDFFLTPLLAFDRRGNRLGYGAGYYDRALAAHPTAYRLGCAFAAQEVPVVPTGPHDQPLHAIATESGLITL
ncbi:MAG TPA: 5-formyltetrahydrofolate cyclo-ligase [Acidiphilium sp.]|nr:5-formyltetrahydrofolate cyclo-ligase [Acidiphilium sp.]HQU22764.1 5-formyltetrahydrofolate cyclo-ligase [Acidiphilium sp.]